MADKEEKGDPMNELYLFLGFMAVLVALCPMQGGCGLPRGGAAAIPVCVVVGGREHL